MKLNGWDVEASDDGQYLYVRRDGKPGEIKVKAEDEGFVIDVWPEEDKEGPVEPDCTMYAYYEDLAAED